MLSEDSFLVGFLGRATDAVCFEIVFVKRDGSFPSGRSWSGAFERISGFSVVRVGWIG